MMSKNSIVPFLKDYLIKFLTRPFLLDTNDGLYKTDKDIPKYVKLHIDDGLQLMNQELHENPNLNGYDYLIDKISHGLEDIIC